MSDEMIDAIGLVGQRQQALERENRRLQKEVKAAKTLLMRMDRKREGLLRMANQLRLNWVPLDVADPEQIALKKDDVHFQKALVKAISSVSGDEVFCTRRERELGQQLTDQVEAETTQEEARMKVADDIAHGHRRYKG